MTKNKIVILGSGLLCTIFVSFTMTLFNSNYASASVISGIKDDLRSLDGRTEASGHTLHWFTLPGKPIDRDSDAIEIPDNFNKVTVQLRTIAYTHKNSRYIPATSYSTNIRKGIGLYADRIKNIDFNAKDVGKGKIVEIGRRPAPGNFTTEAEYRRNYLTLELDIRGIGRSGEVVAMPIPIFSCYHTRGPFNLSGIDNGDEWEGQLIDGRARCNSSDYILKIKRLPTIPPPPASESSHAKTLISVNDNGNKKSIYDRNWSEQNLLAPVGKNLMFYHSVYDGVGYKDDTRSNWSWNTRLGAVNSGLEKTGRGTVVRQGNIHETLRNSRSNSSSMTIKPNQAGQTICDSINYRAEHFRYIYEYKERKENGEVVGYDLQKHEERNPESVDVHSTPRCAYVPYDYELKLCLASLSTTPQVYCGGSDIPTESNKEIPIDPNIENKGSTPTPSNTKWKITQWRVSEDNENIPAGKGGDDNNGKNTCQYYSEVFAGNIRDCKVTNEGEKSIPIGDSYFDSKKIVVPNNAKVGERYCIGLSVSPYSLKQNEDKAKQDSKIGKEWRHAAPICMLVVKKPKVQVWGNGIYTRGGIKTSTTVVSGKTLGSWVEYDAFSAKSIKGFKSESSYTTNNLTFTNNIHHLGNWGVWNSISTANYIENGVRAKFGRNSKNDPVNKVEAEEHRGNYTLNGLDGNNKPDGWTSVIYADNIKINGDIINKNPADNNITNIQQKIIIANNIYIDPRVKRIDAWLIAKNDLITCTENNASFKTKVSNKTCNNELKINAGVVAKNIHSWRTYGSENGMMEKPAEIYNQRADAYMWSYSKGSGDNHIVTTYTKELPVRY